MDTKQLQHFEIKWDIYNYEWIRIYAAKWLHEKTFEILSSLDLSKNAEILILWSWWWAFDRRLINNWYKNITSIDYIWDDYNVKWTNFIEKDLNNDFYELWKYDIIIALEIIEHLENQFHFIRNCKSCMKENWYMILSTPSIESRYARTWFFLFNEFPYFSKYALKNSWHITLIMDHILKFNLKQNKLKIIWEYTNKNYWKFDFFSIRSFISWLIIKFIMLFIKWNNNDINIYLIKNEK